MMKLKIDVFLAVMSPFPNFDVSIKPLLEVINTKIILLFRKDVRPFLQCSIQQHSVDNKDQISIDVNTAII